jgi:hypothetical protein
MIDSWYDLAFPAMMLWLWTAYVPEFQYQAVVIE